MITIIGDLYNKISFYMTIPGHIIDDIKRLSNEDKELIKSAGPIHSVTKSSKHIILHGFYSNIKLKPHYYRNGVWTGTKDYQTYSFILKN
jgi:hypothetical protein